MTCILFLAGSQICSQLFYLSAVRLFYLSAVLCCIIKHKFSIKCILGLPTPDIESLLKFLIRTEYSRNFLPGIYARPQGSPDKKTCWWEGILLKYLLHIHRWALVISLLSVLWAAPASDLTTQVKGLYHIPFSETSSCVMPNWFRRP